MSQFDTLPATLPYDAEQIGHRGVARRLKGPPPLRIILCECENSHSLRILGEELPAFRQEQSGIGLQRRFPHSGKSHIRMHSKTGHAYPRQRSDEYCDTQNSTLPASNHTWVG